MISIHKPEILDKDCKISFKTAFPNLKGIRDKTAPISYITKDLGFISNGLTKRPHDGGKRLDQLRFEIGDYIDIAILKNHSHVREVGGIVGAARAGLERRDSWNRNREDASSRFNPYRRNRPQENERGRGGPDLGRGRGRAQHPWDK